MMDPDLCFIVLRIVDGNLRYFDQEMQHEVAGKLCIADQYAWSDGICGSDHTDDRIGGEDNEEKKL